MTVKILIGTMPKIEQQTGVKLDYSSFTIEQVMKFITNMTSEYKRIFESTSRYPDVTLALLNKMFSFAIYDNSNKVTFKHIWEAIKTCESVYPDVLTKEKIAFKKEFASYLSDENVYTYE
jgi:hypothetical protein